jgi:nucleotide-binding universal stress UspA family protein
MYKHILIPTDGSPTADKAVAAGLEFAREANAMVTLFTAVPEYELPTEAELMARRAQSLQEHERRSLEKARAILEAAAGRAREAGVLVDTEYAQSNRPYEAIIAAARKNACDVIFMGSHGRKGLQELWHGSQTHALLTHSDIPTLVYR